MYTSCYYVFIVDGSYNFGNDALSLGVKRDIHGTNLGYSFHVTLSEDDVSVSPHLIY